MKIETLQRLHDAESAWRELHDFCQGVSESAFLEDRELKLIVQKLVEIVGEALKQAEAYDPEITELIPDFRKIVNTRNRIVHGYGTVNYRLLWTIVQTLILMLQASLVAILAVQQAEESEA